MSVAEQHFAFLHDLAVMLEKTPDYGQALNMALEMIARSQDVIRAAVTVIDPCDGKIRLSAASGLGPDEMRRGEYERGEGVTGQVALSGQAMTIRDAAHEPLFLNRTGCRNLECDKIDFICVPLTLGAEVVGTLSIDMNSEARENQGAMLAAMRIMASMLAPAAYESRSHSADVESVGIAGVIGKSARMQEVYKQILQVAPTRTTVFLEGESGTGKELVAHAIHMASRRSKGPFIALNCAALPENLAESELFGHEKGAFTGAAYTRKGRFELADGGTLFLDEIGELNAMSQAKLLRVLQDGAFERLGSMRTLQTDARLIAATNCDLEQMTAGGAFRRDLFYRLNVFPITLPPLRERREDIPALALHFLRHDPNDSGRGLYRVSPEAMDMLRNYSWPGNIRELRNVIERAALLVEGGSMIMPEHLPEALRNASNSGVDDKAGAYMLEDKMEDLEKSAITGALERSCGHIGKAARELGMTERKLSLRLKRYGLDYHIFRKRRD